MTINTSMSMVKKLLVKPIGSTEFQLHKSLLGLPASDKQKVLDFTEHKLLGLVRQTKDQERKLALLDLLAKYRKGEVAVGWESGVKPVYVLVTKESTR